MEIRKKKEEYMQLLREKAEIEKQQRLVFTSDNFNA